MAVWNVCLKADECRADFWQVSAVCDPSAYVPLLTPALFVSCRHAIVMSGAYSHAVVMPGAYSDTPDMSYAGAAGTLLMLISPHISPTSKT